jgi:hypothetical protein
MLMPVTAQDFVWIGRSIPTEPLMREIVRLSKLASEDISVLATRGYHVGMLEQLRALRARLAAEDDAARKRRCDNNRSAVARGEDLASAENLFRSGIALALCAVATRRVHEQESVVAARRRTAALVEMVELIDRGSLRDSETLRFRIGQLRALLTLQELEPSASDVRGRSELVEKLEVAARNLASYAQETESPAPGPGFDIFNELEGRAWLNLRLMTEVGRAAFLEMGRSDRAILYHLDGGVPSATTLLAR